MAYFSHAFQKTFVINELRTTGNMNPMGGGLGGFFDARTYNAVPLAEASVAQHPQVIFATGGYRPGTPDKMGSHGGYGETFKSEIIDARHVHRLWKTKGRTARLHRIRLGWDGIDAATAPLFYCGQTYHLRIDLKGSPVLRSLDHNFHQIFDLLTGCCSGTTPELVDPVAVMLAFAKQINEGVLSSQFIFARVYDANGQVNSETYVTLTDPAEIANATAALELRVSYSDSQITYFAMDPRDHYELEPLVITSAELIDDSGDACSGFKQLTRTEVLAPAGKEGSGETVLRELILTNEYKQDPFPWTARKKDIQQFALLAANLVNPINYYDSYYILHSTPRKYNPSGTHDNDQYLLRICIDRTNTTLITNVEAWLVAYFGTVNLGLENLSLSGT